MAANNDTLLEIVDLSVMYSVPGGGSVKALDRLCLNIQRGESIAVAGRSGSGKSTLALAMLRMLPANAAVSGTIRFRGRDLHTIPENALEQLRGVRISMVFQQPQTALHPLMRVERQVAEVVAAHHRWGRARCLDHARAILEQIFGSDSERICRRYPHELSGGECQRVCIAQAVSCQPNLLIADEPTAMLDTIAQAGILRILYQLRRKTGVSLVLITHNLALLPGLTDRTVVLRNFDE